MNDPSENQFKNSDTDNRYKIGLQIRDTKYSTQLKTMYI